MSTPHSTMQECARQPQVFRVQEQPRKVSGNELAEHQKRHEIGLLKILAKKHPSVVREMLEVMVK